MSIKKKIGIAVLVILLVMQFIRLDRNKSNAATPNDITAAMEVPAEVQTILKNSCYDCHSNNTEDMWYMNIQPLGWWIQHHINEGKEELNFSEFNSYSAKRKAHKMEEIAEEVKEGEMPLSSYTITHGSAKLNAEQKKLIMDWAMNEHNKLKGNTEEEEDED